MKSPADRVRWNPPIGAARWLVRAPICSTLRRLRGRLPRNRMLAQQPNCRRRGTRLRRPIRADRGDFPAARGPFCDWKPADVFSPFLRVRVLIRGWWKTGPWSIWSARPKAAVKICSWQGLQCSVRHGSHRAARTGPTVEACTTTAIIRLSRCFRRKKDKKRKLFVAIPFGHANPCSPQALNPHFSIKFFTRFIRALGRRRADG